MTIPFNLDELRVMRKFDQYQPKRTDIKSYSRIKSNSSDLATSNTDMQAQRNAIQLTSRKTRAYAMGLPLSKPRSSTIATRSDHIIPKE